MALLRPDANASDLTGHYEVQAPNGSPCVTLHDHLWPGVARESADVLLNAGLGLAPLAMVTDESLADTAGVLRRLDERLQAADVPGSVRGDLLSSAFVLSGLRHDPAAVHDLYRRLAVVLEDSATYQWIKQEGRQEG